MVNATLKFIFIDLIGDIIKFPFWWFSKGIKKSAINFAKSISNMRDSLGIGIWIKNLFKPMFGVRDWQGKIISFIVRVAQIIARSIFFFVFIILRFAIFILWIALPVLIIFQIVNILTSYGR